MERRMGFSQEHKLAFVPIPKNAGESIKANVGLWDYGNRHLTSRELQLIDPVRWEEYFKMAVVRNPWGRY